MMRSESTSAFGQPRETKPTFGAFGERRRVGRASSVIGGLYPGPRRPDAAGPARPGGRGSALVADRLAGRRPGRAVPIVACTGTRVAARRTETSRSETTRTETRLTTLGMEREVLEHVAGLRL